MMRVYLLNAVLLLVVVSSSVVQAAPPPKGEAFYSDVHGAAALVRCMNAVGRFDRSYLPYRDAGLNWMLRQVRDFPDEGRTWLQNPSAPKGFANYHTTVTVVANFNALTALEVYRETKDPELLRVVEDHFDWLKNTAFQKDSPEGPVRAWTSKHFLDPEQRAGKPRPLSSGNSWGFGNILDALVEYYRDTGDNSVLPYLEQGVRYAYLSSTKTYGGAGLHEKTKRRGLAPLSSPDGANEQIHWLRYDGGAVMGFCRGSAGNVHALLNARDAAPGLRITADRTIEDVINAGLRYIIAETKRNQGTAIWENMNGRPGERNVGVGRGVSGIAMVLWRGHEMNIEIGNGDMARQCRETAEATIKTLLGEVESLDRSEPLTEFVARDEPADHSGRLVETIGLCSGISGSYKWLLMYAGEVRENKPELAKRCEEATRTIAHRLINTAYSVDNAYAWKNHLPKFGGEKSVNMALDHGQTGVVIALAEIGWTLKDEAIMNAAKKAADFVVQNLVQEGDGMKMPFLVPIGADVRPRIPQ